MYMRYIWCAKTLIHTQKTLIKWNKTIFIVCTFLLQTNNKRTIPLDVKLDLHQIGGFLCFFEWVYLRWKRTVPAQLKSKPPTSFMRTFMENANAMLRASIIWQLYNPLNNRYLYTNGVTTHVDRQDNNTSKKWISQQLTE